MQERRLSCFIVWCAVEVFVLPCEVSVFRSRYCTDTSLKQRHVVSCGWSSHLYHSRWSSPRRVLWPFGPLSAVRVVKKIESLTSLEGTEYTKL